MAREISDQEFDEVVAGPGVVVVDFWASWCGPCRMLAPIIEELNATYAGKAQVVKINVEDNQENAQKFGVRGIPAVFIFKNGQKVQELVGLQTKDEYRGAIDSHL